MVFGFSSLGCGWVSLGPCGPARQRWLLAALCKHLDRGPTCGGATGQTADDAVCSSLLLVLNPPGRPARVPAIIIIIIVALRGSSPLAPPSPLPSLVCPCSLGPRTVPRVICYSSAADIMECTWSIDRTTSVTTEESMHSRSRSPRRWRTGYASSSSFPPDAPFCCCRSCCISTTPSALTSLSSSTTGPAPPSKDFLRFFCFLRSAFDSRRLPAAAASDCAPVMAPAASPVAVYL